MVPGFRRDDGFCFVYRYNVLKNTHHVEPADDACNYFIYSANQPSAFAQASRLAVSS